MTIEVQTLAEWEASGEVGLLSVVIPAHNEDGHIRDTVTGLARALRAAAIRHEILVVDDDSTDRTAAILGELQAADPAIWSLRNEPPNGFGFAVRRGLAAFRGDVVVLVMADGSDDPDDVVAFHRKLQEGYDCVFGSRFVKGGEAVGYPWTKLLLNRLGNKLIQVMFRLRNNDCTNACKMYRRRVIAAIQPLLSCHFNLTVEIPLKAVVRGFSYATVPNKWRNRRQGTSKFRIKEMGSRYFFVLLYCWLEAKLSRNDYRNDEGLWSKRLQVWPR